VRTLHYYDEIGLLEPTTCTEAGYRLYDDKALEILQQILFFREFELSLKEIKAILENPDFDRETILRGQKKMLELKRDKLTRLILSMDDILEGVNEMEQLISKNEIEELYQTLVTQMDSKQLEVFEQEYGDLEQFHTHFINSASDEKAQANFKKVMEWYGDKDTMLEAAKPISSELLQAYQNRIDSILRKLAELRGKDVSAFEVKAIVGEYDFVAKQLYQMPDVRLMLLEMSELYIGDDKFRTVTDAQYGDGASEYIGRAFKEFYKG
jgi:DNA-binding transcriptional MerR regulator